MSVIFGTKVWNDATPGGKMMLKALNDALILNQIEENSPLVRQALEGEMDVLEASLRQFLTPGVSMTTKQELAGKSKGWSTFELNQLRKSFQLALPDERDINPVQSRQPFKSRRSRLLSWGCVARLLVGLVTTFGLCLMAMLAFFVVTDERGRDVEYWKSLLNPQTCPAIATVRRETNEIIRSGTATAQLKLQSKYEENQKEMDEKYEKDMKEMRDEVERNTQEMKDIVHRELEKLEPKIVSLKGTVDLVERKTANLLSELSDVSGVQDKLESSMEVLSQKVDKFDSALEWQAGMMSDNQQKLTSLKAALEGVMNMTKEYEAHTNKTMYNLTTRVHQAITQAEERVGQVNRTVHRVLNEMNETVLGFNHSISDQMMVIEVKLNNLTGMIGKFVSKYGDWVHIIYPNCGKYFARYVRITVYSSLVYLGFYYLSVNLAMVGFIVPKFVKKHEYFEMLDQGIQTIFGIIRGNAKLFIAYNLCDARVFHGVISVLSWVSKNFAWAFAEETQA